MKYLGKQVNGLATRNNFIRSMDIQNNRTPETALAAYSKTWFSGTRKQWLNEAFKHVRSRSLFWTPKALSDMLEEILLETDLGDKTANRKLARDIDLLKSRITVWAMPRSKKAQITADQMAAYIKAFDTEYRYACPDTFKSCWMNTGAYITLAYGIKYEGLVFPGCNNAQDSLSLLKRCALEVIEAMDHDVDDRMFRLCHGLYLSRFESQDIAAE